MAVTVAVDAMGGDKAPADVVKGAVAAARDGVRVLLVGPRLTIEGLLARQDGTRRRSEWLDMVSCVDAQEVIREGESPVQAVRGKRRASLMVALDLVARGEAQAVVSGGNTGAILVGGKMVLGPLPGIERPALATLVPTLKGATLLIDAGANPTVQPRHLAQFADMGVGFMRSTMGLEAPGVALLNIGREPGKGTELQKEAFGLLSSQRDLNFVGNLEARDIPWGEVEVVVCDGFTGNVVLKTIEGMSGVMIRLLDQGMGNGETGETARRALRAVGERFDYRRRGGAPLLGLRGAVIKCHGASDWQAFRNGISMAARYAEQGLLLRSNNGQGGNGGE